jgi:hypothetical protein
MTRTKAPPLTDEQLRDVLTSFHISHKEMGRRYGRSHQRIVQLRLGQVQAHRLPELPRWTAGRTCEQCIHWVGRCDLGFPDPLEEGVGFARECASFAGVTA